MFGKIVISILCGIGALVLLLFGIGVFIAATANHPAPIVNAVAHTKEPAIDITASALSAAYQANEVAADEIYADKTLRINGHVTSIDKDAFGVIHVMMADNGLFNPGTLLGVNAAMKTDTATTSIASRLFRGQGVTVVCEKVQRIIGSVMLSNCEFDLSTMHSRVPQETRTYEAGADSY